MYCSNIYFWVLLILWHYGILLPETADECCLCSLLNLTLVELKQILESCGLITINNDTVKFVCSTSGYGGKYSWEIFLLENSLTENYFAQKNLTKYKKNSKTFWYIGLGDDRIITINPSTQFHHKKSRKYAELNRLLSENVNKMKSILMINNVFKKVLLRRTILVMIFLFLQMNFCQKLLIVLSLLISLKKL